MVVTEKQMQEKKKIPIPTKEDNPARKYMTKEQAVADNARLQEEREKVADYKAKLKAERDAPVEQVAPTIPDDVEVQEPSDDKDKRIKKLEKKIKAIKGKPGAASIREELNAEIEKIKGE